MLNKVTLVGRLTKDVDLRYTQGGTPTATFTLAVERNFKNKQGEKEADFITVVVWNKLAEHCANYIGKGRLVAVSGRLQTRSWEQDGKRRFVMEVVAEEVSFLDRGKSQHNDDDFYLIEDDKVTIDDVIKITVPGRPVPKGRPRLGMNGRKAYVYTPPETKEYEKLVGWVAKATGCRPVDAPVAVVLDIFTRRKMDVDNVAKSVLDGLNGIAYEDDDQVVALLVRKHRVGNAADERVEIEIREAG